MDEEEKRRLQKGLKALNKQSDYIASSTKDTSVINSRINNTSWKQLVSHPITIMQLSLPRENPNDVTELAVRNGETELLLVSGKIKSNGSIKPVYLPYGWFSRYVLLWINDNIRTTGNRSIYFGSSDAEKLGKMGLGRQTTHYANLKEQMPRLFNLTVNINSIYPEENVGDEKLFPYQGKGERLEKLSLIDIVDGFAKKTSDGKKFRMIVSAKLYDSILSYPLPINMEHVNVLRRNGSTYNLDIYALLAEKLHKIPENKPLSIERDDIEDMFFPNHDSKRRGTLYNEKFKPALEKVKEVYDTANVEFSKKGLILHNSPAPASLENHVHTGLLPKL